MWPSRPSPATIPGARTNAPHRTITTRSTATMRAPINPHASEIARQFCHFDSPSEELQTRPHDTKQIVQNDLRYKHFPAHTDVRYKSDHATKQPTLPEKTLPRRCGTKFSYPQRRTSMARRSETVYITRAPDSPIDTANHPRHHLPRCRAHPAQTPGDYRPRAAIR